MQHSIVVLRQVKRENSGNVLLLPFDFVRVRGWDNMDIGLKGKPFPNFKTKEDPNKDIEWVGSGPECLFRKFDKTGLYLCGDFIPGIDYIDSPHVTLS